MKRYMTCVGVLLLAGMLASCGGGGSDSPSAGSSPATADGGSPATADGGSPATTDGGSPATTDGGSPATTSGGSPGTTTSDSPGTTAGGSPGTTTGGDTGTTPGGSPGTTTGGSPGTTTGGDTGTTTGGTFPSAGARVEESDEKVILSPGWTRSDSRYGWSGGSARQSTVAKATASFTFTGTSVRWIGRRSTSSGIALVSVDGGTPIEVDLYAKPFEIRTPIITLYDLGEGTHTLTIEVTGRQHPLASSNAVVVDAFEVEPPILSHLQESDPDVTYSAGWDKAEDSFRWSGGGIGSSPDERIGGARFTETAGSNVTLKFRGTSVSWIGYRGPNTGIARVRVARADAGAPSIVDIEIDTYAPGEKFQEVMFTASGLADAKHTLTIEATGRKNDASTGARVVVDAFDVTTPGRRYEQAHAKIIYTGEWNDDNVNRTWSEGMAATTSEAGARADFSFTGTSVSWISVKKASIGRAKAYIDGAPVPGVPEIINNFKAVPIEGYQHTIFRLEGLTNGPHTLTIEAVSGITVVDAFDVHP
jgi:hypothetical protein